MTDDSRKKEEKIILKIKEKEFCLGKFDVAVTCDEKLNYSYCTDEKSDHVFRGLASPPQLQEQPCSCFSILKFSHGF